MSLQPSYNGSVVHAHPSHGCPIMQPCVFIDATEVRIVRPVPGVRRLVYVVVRESVSGATGEDRKKRLGSSYPPEVRGTLPGIATPERLKYQR